MRRLICLAMLLLVPFTASYAGNKTVSPQVDLLSITAHRIGEKTGDELYMTITTYPSEGKPSHYRIPKFPSHWMADKLGQINDIKLWKESIKPDQAVTIVFSLIEQDVPPWNTDDLIGTIQLHLKNVNGQIESKWHVVNFLAPPTIVHTKQGTAEKFDLVSEDGHYAVYLLMK